MPRKTAIRITNAEVRKAEHKADAKRDRAMFGSWSTSAPIGLYSMADWRAMRDRMTEHELLKRCQDAARLELRGDRFDAEDRADGAAVVMAAVLTETQGAMPRRDSPRVTLTACCDRVKTHRRSIERQRDRDSQEAKQEAARAALEPSALGIDRESTPAKHVALVGRSSVAMAELAADALCDALALPAERDSAAWTLFYVYARGASPEVCAAEQGVSHGAWRVRQTRGAKFLRGFYSGAELLAKLTLGAREDADSVVYVLEDRSSEAHDRTRMLADVSTGPEGAELGGQRVAHWREVQPTENEVTTSQTTKLHHMTVKARRGTAEQQQQAQADARRAIGRAHAQQSTRERKVNGPDSKAKTASASQPWAPRAARKR